VQPLAWSKAEFRLVRINRLYTATEIAKELGFKSAVTLNQKLADFSQRVPCTRKIQYKVNNSWVLSSKYSNMSYISIKQHILENGKEIYDRKFTQLGRDFILKLFEQQKEPYIIKKQDLQNDEVSKFEFHVL